MVNFVYNTPPYETRKFYGQHNERRATGRRRRRHRHRHRHRRRR